MMLMMTMSRRQQMMKKNGHLDQNTIKKGHSILAARLKSNKSMEFSTNLAKHMSNRIHGYLGQIFSDNHHWSALSYSTQKLDNIWMSYFLKQCKLIPKRPPINSIRDHMSVDKERKCSRNRRHQYKNQENYITNPHCILISEHILPELFHCNLDSSPDRSTKGSLIYNFRNKDENMKQYRSLYCLTSQLTLYMLDMHCINRNSNKLSELIRSTENM